MEGKFIVIDGTDGVGKETQTKKLIERLQQKNFQIKQPNFPRYKNPSSIAVREYLAGNLGTITEINAKTASLFYALDRFCSKAKLISWLEQGNILVSDRYVSANMGHQGSKIDDPEKLGEFFKWLYRIEYEELGLPKPDLNIILYCPTEITKKLRAKRGRAEDIHEQDETHQQKSAQVFKKMGTTLPGFVLINCSKDGEIRTIDDIHEEIWTHVQKIL